MDMLTILNWLTIAGIFALAHLADQYDPTGFKRDAGFKRARVRRQGRR